MSEKTPLEIFFGQDDKNNSSAPSGTIPVGVYYKGGNFYNAAGCGMGDEFYVRWFGRASEFPTSQQVALESIATQPAEPAQGVVLTEADRENLELIIARLEQIKTPDASMPPAAELAEEALVCARAILARHTAPTAAAAIRKEVAKWENGLADADTALRAIERLLDAPTVDSAPQGDSLKDLWIHEDMARDETAALVTSPRKELQAHYVKARDDLAYWKRRALEAEAKAAPQQPAAPIPMILHCPNCGVQHIDAPDERTKGWTNPPHRSHLCHGCGHVWRPADVPTVGVAAIQTRGSNDSPAAERAVPTNIIELATQAGLWEQRAGVWMAVGGEAELKRFAELLSAPSPAPVAQEGSVAQGCRDCGSTGLHACPAAQQTSAQVDALTDEINRLQSKLDSTPVRYGSTRFDLAVQIDKLRSESAALARKDAQ